MILMLDNYDSFTYNLVQELQEISGAEIRVVRNDDEAPDALLALQPQAVVISPGPGTPEQAGVTSTSSARPPTCRCSESASASRRWRRCTVRASNGRPSRCTARRR